MHSGTIRCAMDKMYGRKSSETLDERMDIYSLGAVFYRMMSGYLPDAQNGVPYALSQMIFRMRTV